MAVLNLKEQSETAAIKLSNKVELPKNAYVIRIRKEEFTKSKSTDRPMIVLDWEILAPDEVKNAKGETIACGGFESKLYYSLSGDDSKKTAANIKRLTDLWALCGFTPDELDTENPPLIFQKAIDEGTPIQLDAVLYGKRVPKNGPDGKPITINGKELEEYQVVVEGIYGVNTTDLGIPFN